MILAPAGEKVVEHYSFYGAFATSIEYGVIFGSQPIGTLPAAYLSQVGDHFLLAGRRWQVLEIHDRQKVISVNPAKGRKPTGFYGASGEIHPRVRREMKNVILSQNRYRYLDSRADELLQQARQIAVQTGLDKSDWLELGSFGLHGRELKSNEH